MSDKNCTTKYDKYPEKNIPGFTAFEGWDDILDELKKACRNGIIVAEFYPGVESEKIVCQLARLGAAMFSAEECMLSKEDYHKRIA